MEYEARPGESRLRRVAAAGKARGERQEWEELVARLRGHGWLVKVVTTA
jgi:hypothetical protein